MSGKTKNGKMSSNKSENNRPAPYKIQLRKFAKPLNQKTSATSNHQQATPVPQLTPQATNRSNQQASQKTRLASDIRELYTNLNNPLSYSGNADEILNKITSYK